MNKASFEFMGCDSSFEESSIVIFGAPFDGTTSYRPGTRFGPNAMRQESFGIETFSPYLEKDLLDYNIFDAGDLELAMGNPKQAVNDIKEMTKKIINANKIPFMFGGEHLVTLGTVEALVEKYPNMNIIHLDAHADLREDYMNEKYSHACVIRRCHDLMQPHKIYQFGIRSMTFEEHEFAKENTTMEKFDITTIKEVVEKIKDEPVYITIDLDVLDPSIFSGTGTPEPGGITYIQLMSAIHSFSKLNNVIGMDLNELSPHYDHSGTSTAAACKAVRELILSVVK